MNNEAVAENGVFDFRALKIHTLPNSKASLILEIEGLNWSERAGILSSTFQLDFDMRACVEGE